MTAAFPETVVPVLATARLTLRPLAVSDAEAAFTVFGDAEAMRFWDRPPAADIAEVAQRLTALLGIPRAFAGGWLVSLNADGQFAGAVFYHHREPRNRRLELGWITRRALWRQGFMREALGAVLAHVFTPEPEGGMGAMRVEATIEPGNAASIALAGRLGFRLEGGPMRSRLVVDGAFRDQLMFGLLASDPRGAA